MQARRRINARWLLTIAAVAAGSTGIGFLIGYLLGS
jgi:hypothetical protein